MVAWREAGFDSEGNGIQRGDVGAAIETAAGTFGGPEHIADANTSGVQLATSPAGETVLAWSDSDESGGNLRYAVRPSGGQFGAAQDVPGAHAGVLSTLADGTVLAHWGRNGIHALARQPQGDFGAAETISPTGRFPAAADGAVVWLEGQVLKISTQSSRSGRAHGPVTRARSSLTHRRLEAATAPSRPHSRAQWAIASA